MKKRILLISVIILIVVVFSVKVLADNNSSYDSKLLAIQEVADAYYRRKLTIQYESMKRDYLLGPEDATDDKIMNTTCHAFAYQLYKQTFNLEIPKGVSETYEYCKIKKNTEYVPIYYVPNNFTNTTSDYQNESAEYRNLLAAFDTGDKENDTKFLSFLNTLNVGDVITQSRRNNQAKKTSSHTMVVYKFIYDDQGNKIDCYLIESVFSSELNGGLADETGDKLEVYGSIKKKKLSERLQYYANSYNTYKPLCLVVLRPLGNTGSSFVNISMDDLKAHNINNNVTVNEQNQEIRITDATADRLKYSGIEITKVSTKHHNSIVSLGDEITYTISIKNNSSAKYTGIQVKEFVDSELLELVSNEVESTALQNGKIQLTWNNISIAAKATKVIEYTVRVKIDESNINKTIVSEGNVENIKTATVTNKIGACLSDEEISTLKECANSIDYTSYSNGFKLVSDIYNQAFNANINLKKSNNSYIKVSEIIRTTDSKDLEIINNEIGKMIVNDLYGSWEASCKVKSDDRYYVWGTASQEVGDQRAKTIIKGNLNIGDIILIEDDGVNSAYIYLGDKILGANKVISQIENADDKYNPGDDETIFLADLVSKDLFVIISPALCIDMTKTEVGVNYSSKSPTSEHVIVTIEANEKIQSVNGWNRSSNGKILTKEYVNNVDENITIKDLAGNAKNVNIKIENIVDKQKGDLNENNQIDIGDLIIIYRHISSTNKESVANKHPDWILSDEMVALGDLNKNGRLDIGDGLKIQRYIAAKNNAEVANQHPDWLVLE